MNIYKGTDRTAYVGERYTVKVARSNPRQFLKSAQNTRERSGLKGVVNAWNALNADQHQSLKNFLLHGVMANRREHRLAKHDGGIVVPTVSTLRGLVNIQRTIPSTGLDHAEIHSAFAEHLGPKVTALGHMLEDPSNLGVVDGQVRFVDGGSIGLERLTQTHEEPLGRALGSLALRLNNSTP